LPGNLQENRILPRFSELEYSLEHSDGYPYCLGHPGSRIPSREVCSFSRRCPPVLCTSLQGTVNHARNPPPTPPHTYSDNTATAGATISNEQLMALFEKPATAKRFVDTCYSSLFYKRTPRHVENPLSFQVSSRAKQYQTKSPARSATSPRKAISFKDAPEPEGRRRGN
jgi:hypothetical protein